MKAHEQRLQSEADIQELLQRHPSLVEGSDSFDEVILLVVVALLQKRDHFFAPNQSGQTEIQLKTIPESKVGRFQVIAHPGHDLEPFLCSTKQYEEALRIYQEIIDSKRSFTFRLSSGLPRLMRAARNVLSRKI